MYSKLERKGGKKDNCKQKGIRTKPDKNCFDLEKNMIKNKEKERMKEGRNQRRKNAKKEEKNKARHEFQKKKERRNLKSE